MFDVLKNFFSRIIGIKVLSITVLGPLASGKSTLNLKLGRLSAYTGETRIPGEELGRVVLKIKNKTIVIVKGLDIGGSEESSIIHLKKQIESSQLIFFVFDSFIFFSHEQDKNRALGFLKKIISLSDVNKRFLIVGSHFDLFQKDISLNLNSKKEFEKKLEDQIFSMFQGRKHDIILCDLNSEKSISEIKNLLLKK